MRILILVILVIIASGCALLGNNKPPLKPVESRQAPEITPEITPEPSTETVEVVPTSIIPIATTTRSNKSNLENFGPAPEITNDVWLNVDRPLRLAELGGKVVLLEMWTFG